MGGVFLHVLGDALGNVGVIATALFIWLTDFSWRFYADPVISLVITAIIFSSALPLVKSASLILLQGVPSGISIDDVKEDILQVPPKNLPLHMGIDGVD
jgi:zinc transporter 1